MLLTEDKEDEVKDVFYEQLEQAYGSLPVYHMKLVLGDFIAQVGNEKIYLGTIGRQSLHTTSNRNGMCLISFAAGRNLMVSSTFFSHPKIHKQTWTSPDGATKNQIDHVLTNRRHSSSILDVRSFRGASFDSEYNLVRTCLRCRISLSNTKSNIKQRRINIEALKIPTTAQHFEEYVKLELNSISENSDIDRHWSACAEEAVFERRILRIIYLFFEGEC